jgi:polyisoprenoid-binding protein YceI
VASSEVENMISRIAAPALLVALLAAPVLAADTYRVDPVHSSVHFRIRHMNVAFVLGRFDDLSGVIAFDADDPEACSVSMTVKAASVNTGNDKRDAHLRSADFFEVETYPEIAFRSTAWTRTGEGRYDVAGDLSLHGVTRSVTASVELTGAGEGRGGKRLVGFLATLSLKRSDFGMTKMVGPVGDAVDLTIAVEAGEVEMPPAANRIDDDHAPTPYSAEEIRQGCPAGRVVTYRLEQLAGRDGQPLPEPRVSRQVFRFRGGTAERAEIDIVTQTADGETQGEPRTNTMTWKQLQGHASYPAANTTITTETIETPVGKLECWRYEVSIGQGEKTNVQRYWFAKDRAGPPVKVTHEVDGTSTFTMVMLSDERK